MLDLDTLLDTIRHRTVGSQFLDQQVLQHLRIEGVQKVQHRDGHWDYPEKFQITRSLDAVLRHIPKNWYRSVIAPAQNTQSPIRVELIERGPGVRQAHACLHRNEILATVCALLIGLRFQAQNAEKGPNGTNR